MYVLNDDNPQKSTPLLTREDFVEFFGEDGGDNLECLLALDLTVDEFALAAAWAISDSGQSAVIREPVSSKVIAAYYLMLTDSGFDLDH